MPSEEQLKPAHTPSAILVWLRVSRKWTITGINRKNRVSRFASGHYQSKAFVLMPKMSMQFYNILNETDKHRKDLQRVTAKLKASISQYIVYKHTY